MLSSIKFSNHWRYCLAVTRPALLLAPNYFLSELHLRLADHGIQNAIAARNIAPIFDWIISLLDRQGISNAAASAFAAQHGNARWSDVAGAIGTRPRCPKLRSHWHFHECGYRKTTQTCAFPHELPYCPLPAVPARKGMLNQTAFGLGLFVRDVCGGDLVGWIDGRLAEADLGFHAANRAGQMRNSLLQPLCQIAGTGPNVW